MKRLKYICISIAAVALALCLAFATACADSDDESEKGTDAVVHLNKTVIALDLHEYELLTATTENTDEAIVWKSADEHIATVTDGRVSSVSAGETTVTASAGGASATCIVSVYNSQSAPVLSFDHVYESIDHEGRYMDVRIARGGSYTLTGGVVYKGTPVAEQDIDYEITAKDAGASAVARLTYQGGGSILVEGLSLGTANFYVAASVYGSYLVKTVRVSVCSIGVSFDIEGLELSGEVYPLELSTATGEVKNVTTSFALKPIVHDEGVKVTNPEIDWTSDDTSVAKIEGGKIVSGLRGITTVHGTYEADGARGEIAICVNVTSPTVTISDTATIEVESLQPVSVKKTPESAVTDVLLDGESVGTFSNNNITFIKANMPVTAKELGEGRTLILVTDTVYYAMTVNVYTKVLRDKSDLDGMGAIARANGKDRAFTKGEGIVWEGYFVLGGNIIYNNKFTPFISDADIWRMTQKGQATSVPDLEGKAWDNGDIFGFRGVFDGKGYNISGLRIENSDTSSTSLFTVLHHEGVVQNVSFTSAVVKGGGGYVCSVGCGVVRNVSVTYSDIAGGNGDNGRPCGTFFSYTINTGGCDHAFMESCYVDASGVTAPIGGKVRLVGLAGSERPVYNGVYAVCANEEVCANAFGGNSHGGNACGVFTDTAALKADTDAQTNIAKWDTAYWNISSGVPTFRTKS